MILRAMQWMGNKWIVRPVSRFASGVQMQISSATNTVFRKVYLDRRKRRREESRRQKIEKLREKYRYQHSE